MLVEIDNDRGKRFAEIHGHFLTLLAEALQHMTIYQVKTFAHVDFECTVPVKKNAP